MICESSEREQNIADSDREAVAQDKMDGRTVA
jgi:hypothetical protein